MSTRESFNPESYELDKSFRLTRFTELKGTGCKVPQDVLQKLLESLQENHFQEDEQFLGAVMPRLGKKYYIAVSGDLQDFEELGLKAVPTAQLTAKLWRNERAGFDVGLSRNENILRRLLDNCQEEKKSVNA
ncbi:hypothetical protein P7K49_014859 [Saguinus oedipus]|uniref:Uncharacterized protein n=1 Tax=Saguinus oedipus TaxID=9490 RepID=A0ABQ9V8F1_SAGOE|nr:hypothetical protein P7K49_014859 [Saguinus oedipus]